MLNLDFLRNHSEAEHIPLNHILKNCTNHINPSMDDLWIPTSLGRRSMLGFTLLYLCLIISLSIMYQYSKQNQGLATANDRYHYMWKFGPVAIFTVISGYWYLVESRTKLLAPWRAMHASPTVATKSLLLDYVSENNFVTLYTSLKNGDFDVSLALAGTFCLKLLVLFSTGLLFVKQQSISYHNVPIQMASRFDDSKVIPSGADLFAMPYAVRKLGLGSPPGAANDFAYQSVKGTMMPVDATARVIVDAYSPDISCEIANASWTAAMMNSDLEVLRLNINATTSGCEALMVVLLGYEEKSSSTLGIETATCSDPHGGSSVKLAIFAGNITFSDYPSINNYNSRLGNDSSTTIPATHAFTYIAATPVSTYAACLFCTIVGQLRRASLTVTQDSTDASILPIGNGESRLINETSQKQNTWNLVESFSFDSTWSLFGQTKWDGITESPLFVLMNDSTPRHLIEETVDVDWLMEAAPKALRFVISQLAAADLFSDDKENILGDITILENRLILSELAFSLMIEALCLMSVISLIICIRSGAAPKSPACIAALATILARSPEVTVRLLGLGHSESETRRMLQHQSLLEWRSLTTQELSIIWIKKLRNCHNSTTQPRKETNDSKITWWHPWPSSDLTRASVLLLSGGGIVLLQLLFNYSEHHHGITEVSGNDFVQFSWLFIPVSSIFCLNSLVEGISFTGRVIQPYVTLRNGPCTAQKSLYIDLVHRTTVSAMYHSMRMRYFGVLAAITATILGATLPISASGLFMEFSVSQVATISLQQMDGFDPSAEFRMSPDGNFGLPTPTLILYNNLSYPRGTQGKYAMPQFIPTDAGSAYLKNEPSPGTRINVNISAVYGVANCTILQPRDVTVAWQKPDTDYAENVNITIATVENCPQLEEAVRFEPGFDEDIVAGWNRISRFFNVFNVTDAFPRCPMSFLYFLKGTLTTGGQSPRFELKNQKFLQCTPYVEQEMVNVEFVLPNYEISPSRPPFPIPGTRKFFSRAQLLLNHGVKEYLPDHTLSHASEESIALRFDHFCTALFSGPGAIPLSVIFENTTDSHNNLLARIEEVYGTIVAQVYGAQRRIPISPQASAPIFNGTLTHEARRLKQEEIPTRIIQSLLAAMLLCSVVSAVLSNGKYVLPQNPCSIGAVASLLANSSILTEKVIPVGSESLDWKELQRQGIFEGHLYSMGWWGEKGARWFGIDIGEADREK